MKRTGGGQKVYKERDWKKAVVTFSPDTFPEVFAEFSEPPKVAAPEKKAEE